MIISHLKVLESRGVSAQGHERAGERIESQEGHARCHRKIERLPHRRTDAPEPPSPHILRHEGCCIVGGVLKECQRCPEQQRGWHGGRHGIVAEPAQERPVDRYLQGPEAIAQDQRDCQAQQFPSTAVFRVMRCSGSVSHPDPSYKPEASSESVIKLRQTRGFRVR